MRKRIPAVAGFENEHGDNEEDNTRGDEGPPRSSRAAVGRRSIVHLLILAAVFFLCMVFLATGLTLKKASSNDACQVYNAAYFLKLLSSIQAMPPNASVSTFYSSNSNTNKSSPLCTANVVPRDKCRCLNPFVPVPQNPQRVSQWHALSQWNAKLVETNYTSRHLQPDLVIYGDSITERLLGRFFGSSGPNMREYAHMTYQLLSTEGGARFNGLPLGISSDENGELPTTLQPKVWWILIGTNDINAGCSVETIVAGNIRIVQELQRHDRWNVSQRPAPIIINSLLPRGRQPLVLADNAMWRTITAINEQLACYASVTSGIFFANLTDRFVETRSRDRKTVVHPDMFVKDNLHPSVHGSRVWEKYMVDKLLSLGTSLRVASSLAR